MREEKEKNETDLGSRQHMRVILYMILSYLSILMTVLYKKENIVSRINY